MPPAPVVARPERETRAYVPWGMLAAIDLHGVRPKAARGPRRASAASFRP